MRFLLLLILVIPLNFLDAQEKFEIDGAITIDDSNSDTPDPGTIRFNPDTKDFQGWNGSKWVSLTSGLSIESQIQDIDGNLYQTVRIGQQEWMVDNLRTSKFQDGTPILELQDWYDSQTPAWCWYNNDSANYEEPYGKLYNWYCVNGDSICPIGWRVPTQLDWNDLANYMGGLPTGAGPLKETGFDHWNGPNTAGTNITGFTALPGGLRLVDDGSSINSGTKGYYWSITDVDVNTAIYGILRHDDDALGLLGLLSKGSGLSVRCMKN